MGGEGGVGGGGLGGEGLGTHGVGVFRRWGRWGWRGFGHALEACKNLAVSGGSRGRAGGGVGGGGGLGTHWRPVRTFYLQQ